ncbi:hypothetical protein MUK42_37673 [Musa troglodytarum]|uniref:Uncharacterized protein n=1 Tax=Musa troglodytarum TaxID=320322 RepID=A0A9E7KBB4_9LILI|nr:hypothetical protein MUK42_37673 [Musa troglodytarum]
MQKLYLGILIKRLIQISGSSQVGVVLAVESNQCLISSSSTEGNKLGIHVKVGVGGTSLPRLSARTK